MIFFKKSKEEMKKIINMMSKEDFWESVEDLASGDPERTLKALNKTEEYAKFYENFMENMEKRDRKVIKGMIKEIRDYLRKGISIQSILATYEAGINKLEREGKYLFKEEIIK